MVLRTTWHPVLAAHELRSGENIVGALVHGNELALWRSVQGVAQAWENRCPHRGVRLTLGRIVNGRLSCAYHGWEYAAGSGRCELVPAMPDQPVPGRVCVRTYQVAEAQSMVWVGLDAEPASLPAQEAAAAPASEPGSATLMPVAPDSGLPAVFCRTLAVRASPARVVSALAQRDFSQAAPFVWRGALARWPMIAFSLAAAPGLTMLHLWHVTQPRDAIARAVFAAARRLRAEIEAGTG